MRDGGNKEKDQEIEKAGERVRLGRHEDNS